MLIIYGTKVFKKEKGETSAPCQCNNCGAMMPWKLMKVTKWFHLCYIPIFPFSFKKYLICPNCESGIKVKKDNEENIMSMLK